MSWRPAEPVARLAVRPGPALSHHHDHMLARGNPAKPAGNRERRLGTEHPGELRQPFAHRRRLVVDDVVNPRGASFDRQRRRLGGVVDMQERPPAASVANHGDAPAAELIDDRSIEQPGARSVEDSIAQNHAFERCRASDGAFEMMYPARELLNSRAGAGSSASSSVLTGTIRANGQPQKLCAM